MKNRKWIFFVAPPAAILFVFLFGELVKYLWNWLVPALFTGAHVITYWQAVGLLLLARILFGSWHSKGGHGPRRAWRKPLTSMTPEELEVVLQHRATRCGNTVPPEQNPGTGPA